eukprot:NODE_477_length_7951_cov_0.254075.p6 type:complete len:103 gc:universal NODE_477_length_7951_cov_0.254075:5940-5632(-)
MLRQKIASLEKVLDAIKSQNFHIIDVRRREDEFAHGAIPTAKNIPLDEIESNPRILERYRDKPMLFYCKSGSRSSRATILAESLKLRAENYKGSWDEFKKHY